MSPQRPWNPLRDARIAKHLERGDQDAALAEMQGWEVHSADFQSYTLGSATVTEVGGKWRWEAHSTNFAAQYTTDNWWGICASAADARKEAEAYLKEFPDEG